MFICLFFVKTMKIIFKHLKTLILYEFYLINLMNYCELK